METICEEEEWRLIRELKNHKEVYISNLGRVKNKNGDILKQRFDKYGYKRISFTIIVNNKKVSKTRFIHRLIAMEFIENPNNYPQVKFKNGDRTDVSINNLEWCKKCNSKRRKIVNKNRPIVNLDTEEEFANITAASKLYKIGVGSLYNCCIGKMRTAGGYRWKYAK